VLSYTWKWKYILCRLSILQGMTEWAVLIGYFLALCVYVATHMAISHVHSNHTMETMQWESCWKQNWQYIFSTEYRAKITCWYLWQLTKPSPLASVHVWLALTVSCWIVQSCTSSCLGRQYGEILQSLSVFRLTKLAAHVQYGHTPKVLSYFNGPTYGSQSL